MDDVCLSCADNRGKNNNGNILLLRWRPSHHVPRLQPSKRRTLSSSSLSSLFSSSPVKNGEKKTTKQKKEKPPTDKKQQRKRKIDEPEAAEVEIASMATFEPVAPLAFGSVRYMSKKKITKSASSREARDSVSASRGSMKTSGGKKNAEGADANSSGQDDIGNNNGGKGKEDDDVVVVGDDDDDTDDNDTSVGGNGGNNEDGNNAATGTITLDKLLELDEDTRTDIALALRCIIARAGEPVDVVLESAAKASKRGPRAAERLVEYAKFALELGAAEAARAQLPLGDVDARQRWCAALFLERHWPHRNHYAGRTLLLKYGHPSDLEIGPNGGISIAKQAKKKPRPEQQQQQQQQQRSRKQTMRFGTSRVPTAPTRSFFAAKTPDSSSSSPLPPDSNGADEEDVAVVAADIDDEEVQEITKESKESKEPKETKEAETGPEIALGPTLASAVTSQSSGSSSMSATRQQLPPLGETSFAAHMHATHWLPPPRMWKKMIQHTRHRILEGMCYVYMGYSVPEVMRAFDLPPNFAHYLPTPSPDKASMAKLLDSFVTKRLLHIFATCAADTKRIRNGVRALIEQLDKQMMAHILGKYESRSLSAAAAPPVPSSLSSNVFSSTAFVDDDLSEARAADNDNDNNVELNEDMAVGEQDDNSNDNNVANDDDDGPASIASSPPPPPPPQQQQRQRRQLVSDQKNTTSSLHRNSEHPGDRAPPSDELPAQPKGAYASPSSSSPSSSSPSSSRPPTISASTAPFFSNPPSRPVRFATALDVVRVGVPVNVAKLLLHSDPQECRRLDEALTPQLPVLFAQLEPRGIMKLAEIALARHLESLKKKTTTGKQPSANNNSNNGVTGTHVNSGSDDGSSAEAPPSSSAREEKKDATAAEELSIDNLVNLLPSWERSAFYQQTGSPMPVASVSAPVSASAVPSAPPVPLVPVPPAAPPMSAPPMPAVPAKREKVILPLQPLSAPQLPSPRSLPTNASTVSPSNLQKSSLLSSLSSLSSSFESLFALRAPMASRATTSNAARAAATSSLPQSPALLPAAVDLPATSKCNSPAETVTPPNNFAPLPPVLQKNANFGKINSTGSSPQGVSSFALPRAPVSGVAV